MVDVVLPVLDEADALPWVLGRMPSDFHPIVVDNGSIDDSVAIARAHGAHVVEEVQRGFGAACARGLAEATADLVCFMDCDGSLDPHDLPTLVERVRSGSADLVLGRRVAERGAWPIHARVANTLLATIVRRRYGLQIRDLGPMRVGRTDQLRSLQIQDRRSGWPLEMVLKAAAVGLKITEVPVPYHARSGRSKVTGTIKGTMTATRDMSRLLT